MDTISPYSLNLSHLDLQILAVPMICSFSVTTRLIFPPFVIVPAHLPAGILSRYSCGMRFLYACFQLLSYILLITNKSSFSSKNLIFILLPSVCPVYKSRTIKTSAWKFVLYLSVSIKPALRYKAIALSLVDSESRYIFLYPNFRAFSMAYKRSFFPYPIP